MPCNAQITSFAVSVSDQDVNNRNDNDPTTTRSNAFAKEPVVSRPHSVTPYMYPCSPYLCEPHGQKKEQLEKQARKTEQNRIFQDKCSVVLSRSDARHVVVLRQRRQILVQLLDSLLVCFRATFAAETLVELSRNICQYTFEMRGFCNAPTYPLPLNLLMPPLSLRLP